MESDTTLCVMSVGLSLRRIMINRIQLLGIVLVVLSIPGFIFGGFVLGWPCFAGGLLMYILFNKKPKEKVEVIEE